MTKTEPYSDSVALSCSSSIAKSELPEAPSTLSVEGQASRISIANSRMDHALADLEEALRGVLHSPAPAPDCKSAAADTPELPPAVDYLRILGNNTHAQLVRLDDLASRLAISDNQSKVDELSPSLSEFNGLASLEGQCKALDIVAKVQCGQLTALAVIIAPILDPDLKGGEGAGSDPLPPVAEATSLLMGIAAQFERNVEYAQGLISRINMR